MVLLQYYEYREGVNNYAQSLHSNFKVNFIIIWQGKSEHSDWFFLGRDFAIRTISVETVISCVFFVFESRQTQNKHGASAI